MPHVYRHIRLDKNEPFYIGIGLDDECKRAYEVKKRRSDWWNRIATKHGYSVDILFENVTIEFAKEKEKEFIALYGRMDINTGTLCNQTNGGDGINGWKPSEDTLENMRRAAKIRGCNLNTPEIIAKRAKTNTGKKRTLEQCERLAAWQRGVPKSKELVEKIRITNSLPHNVEKSKNQVNCKKVFCINNNIIYRSCAEAARQLNVSKSAISFVCLGKLKSVKGYKLIHYKEAKLK